MCGRPPPSVASFSWNLFCLLVPTRPLLIMKLQPLILFRVSNGPFPSSFCTVGQRTLPWQSRILGATCYFPKYPKSFPLPSNALLPLPDSPRLFFIVWPTLIAVSLLLIPPSILCNVLLTLTLHPFFPTAESVFSPEPQDRFYFPQVFFSILVLFLFTVSHMLLSSLSSLYLSCLSSLLCRFFSLGSPSHHD